MQLDFLRVSNRKLTTNCIRALNKAVIDNAPIIFLEYEGSGKTINELTNVVQDYENCFYIEKYIDDGSSKVAEIIEDYNIVPDKFVIAGVNTDACVLATVRGLRMRYDQDISILESACDSIHFHTNGIEILKNIKGVSII